MRSVGTRVLALALVVGAPVVALGGGLPGAGERATDDVWLQAQPVSGGGRGITGASITDGSIGEEDLGTDSVGADEIQSGAVRSDEIESGAVGSDEIGSGAVGSDEIQTGAVGADEIGANAVWSEGIRDGEVKTADLADEHVITSKLAIWAVTTDRIFPGAVTAGKLAHANDFGVGGAVVESTISNNAVSTRTIVDQAVDASKLAPGAITNSAILDGTIALGKLDTDVATQLELEEQLADLELTLGSQITTGINGLRFDLADGDGVHDSMDAVSWFNIRDLPAGFADDTDEVDGGRAGDLLCADAGCVDAWELASGAVTGSHIVNGAIGASHLATDAVGSDEILDGSVATFDLADGAVTTDKQTANVGSGVVPFYGSVTTSADVALAGLSLSPGSHKVLVTGHATVSCDDCDNAGDQLSVTWRIVEGSTTVGTLSTLTLTHAAPQAVLPVSGLALASVPTPTLHLYKLEVSVVGATGQVTVHNATLTAVDLGR